MNTQPITLQLPPELLAQDQEIIGNSEDLNSFLVRAIKNEIQRSQPPEQKTKFWENVEQLRAQMLAIDLEIDPDEVWGDVRDRCPGRELIL
jgi:hypothetical protein